MSKKTSEFQIFLSRLGRYFKKLDRIGMIWYGIVLFAIFLLIVPLFSFTVINHDFYKNMADNQQRRIERNPSSRGIITSSAESLGGMVALSTDVGTLAIDPTQNGSMPKLLEFLSDVVLREFCSRRPKQKCIETVGVYVRQDFSAEKNITEAFLKTAISNYLQEKINTPIESVLVQENVSDDKVEKINALDNQALFFVVNNLYVNPTKVQNGENLAEQLSGILGMEKEDIMPKFAIREKRYLAIIRKMSIGTRDWVVEFMNKNKEVTQNYITEVRRKLAIKAITQEESDALIKQVLLEHAVYPYVRIEHNLLRYYPEGDTLGQITGFVDNEGKGRYGIEGYFENELQGESPIKIVTKDEKGRPIRNYTGTGDLILQNGVNMALTIDRNIQKEISRRLEQANKIYRANRISVIVTNPKTGAVTAMVNYPSFDPNQFTDVYEMEPVLYTEYRDPLFELFGFPMFVIDSNQGTIVNNIDGKRVKLRPATEDEIKNTAIQKFKYKNGYGVGNYQNPVVSSLYEPGSVFKAFTVAIGLDTGEIRPNDIYYDKNYVELDIGGGVKRKIHNLAKSKCGGRHTYLNALSWSCNVGMINIVQKIGRSLFDSYIRNFGFGTKTDITLDGEVFSQIESYNKWSRTRFFNMAFGQGISATMLQMASAYNVLANGGIYMQPYIVESITYPNGKKIDTVPTPLRRVIKEETSKTITAMMVDGVRNGFAEKGGVPGYTMAGKTGTSQIPYRGTYENIYFKQELGHTTTSYGGYAPAYNPKFVMIVVIERPRNAQYAEQTAAALYANLAEYLLTYYKVPKWQE